MLFGRKKHIEAIRRHGPPLSDDEFLVEAGVPNPARDVALGVRRVLAKHCGVENEQIRPDLPLAMLWPAMRSGLCWGWDFLSFTLALELETGIKVLIRENELNEFTRPEISTGDWAREVARRVVQGECPR